MSVFNPAPLTAINLATSAVSTQQLPGRIYLEVPILSSRHCYTQVLGFGGCWIWEQDASYQNITQQFQS